ncbi:hypothetical protein K505DRAFT_343305 [Melanomma pulvis-pyrius CBS 109.77]|uniref:Uncharacterized protein n=1 Tax=Melanomma pulvis-pyrius CBS 109.77 TaxID=1314802 RepID=A0A6A6WSC7_9PLEO|nr:hypothetical protein K505DRAFT_343305 [Melanomma pulvis-pyrius CBS 109.77]
MSFDRRIRDNKEDIDTLYDITTSHTNIFTNISAGLRIHETSTSLYEQAINDYASRLTVAIEEDREAKTKEGDAIAKSLQSLEQRTESNTRRIENQDQVNTSLRDLMEQRLKPLEEKMALLLQKQMTESEEPSDKEKASKEEESANEEPPNPILDPNTPVSATDLLKVLEIMERLYVTTSTDRQHSRQRVTSLASEVEQFTEWEVDFKRRIDEMQAKIDALNAQRDGVEQASWGSSSWVDDVDR